MGATHECTDVLLYGCTSWAQMKRVEKEVDGSHTRMQWGFAVRPLTFHLKTTQVRRIRHVGNEWRSKEELISDVPRWNSTHGCTDVGRPETTCSVRTMDTDYKTSQGRWMIRTDGERESPRTLCYQHDLMIVMMMIMMIFNILKLTTYICSLLQ